MLKCKCPTTKDKDGITHHWHYPRCPVVKAIIKAGILDKPLCRKCRDDIISGGGNGGTKSKTSKVLGKRVACTHKYSGRKRI